MNAHRQSQPCIVPGWLLLSSLLILSLLINACGSSTNQTTASSTPAQQRTATHTAENEQPLAVYRLSDLYTNDTRSIAFSGDGHMLATATSNGTVQLWDVMSGKRVRTLTYPSTPSLPVITMNAVTFSPNGQILAAGTQEQTVQLWNVNTGKLLRTFSNGTDDVSILVYLADSRLVATVSRDQALTLWKVDMLQ